MAATVEKQSGETKIKEKTGFQRKWESFHKNVTAEYNKNAVLFLIKKTFWILSRIKPTVMEADLDFSLGDPALTGGATGIISLWPVCYGKKFQILKVMILIFGEVFP